MRRFITILGLLPLVTLFVSARVVAQTDLHETKKERIALIRAEIRAQINQLENLERQLIAAVTNEKPLRKRVRNVAKVAEPQAGPGLIGHAVVDGHDSKILFHYVHGKVFNPEPLRSRIDGDFVLTLSGQLQVPCDMIVKVFHAGGGVNGDVNTLFIDDQKISSVGDDRKKQAIEKIKLTKGSHTIVWQLTGGTFRNNLLKFVESESGDMLPLGFAKDGLPDDSKKEVVRVGSDRRGWPIPTDW